MALYRLGRGTAACLVGALLALSAHAGPLPPSAVIEEFHAVLLNVMREARGLGFEGRYEWLKPVVRDTFDIPYMTRVSTGYYWSKANEQRQHELIDAFARMTVANYAARFDDYSGQRFETVSQEPGARDSVIVRTRLVKTDGSTISLNYVMHRTDWSWQVIDIYLKSTYSELANRRSEYTSILRRKGFKGLLATIDRKVKTLAEEARQG